MIEQSTLIAHLLFSSTDGHTDLVTALETLLFTLFVVAKICKKEKAIFMFQHHFDDSLDTLRAYQKGA